MTAFRVEAAVAADAAAVTEVIAALETSLYGQSSLSQADVEDEWLDLDLERNARVVRDGRASALLALGRCAKKASSGKPKDLCIPMRSGGESGS